MFQRNPLNILLRGAAIAMLLSGLAGCSMNTTTVTEKPSESILQLQKLAPNARPRVAVLDFANKANITSEAKIGRGMADQMVTALVTENAFTVIERARLDAVDSEQVLNNDSNRFNPQSASKVGKLLGVNFFIVGAITEFEGDESSLAATIAPGKLGGGSYAFFMPLIQAMFKTTHIAIDVRVIDVETGQIVHANSVEGSSAEAGAGLSGFAHNFGVALSGNTKYPTEKAVRNCIKKAVNVVADSVKDYNAGASAPAVSKKSTVSVTAETGNLRATASTEARKIKTLSEGDSLEILEEGAGWTKVKTSDGKEGWVINKIIEAK
ncbi:TPA: hypothetical protein DDW35_08440 [Candidatus Sumerlaeota bacterium]|jgi:curli biogenesis system outer membrane secretion channel CsgG|nr:hypothetical protein [Candidatus Sumerlaeota bacterium]